MCAATLALLIAALWNGYPLVYSDTSAYLASGFLLETPIDRPITYGLFMRVCSLNGFSLGLVVLAQAMLLAHAMGLALRGVGIDRSHAGAMDARRSGRLSPGTPPRRCR